MAEADCPLLDTFYFSLPEVARPLYTPRSTNAQPFMVAEGTNKIRIGGYEQAPEVLLQTLQRRVHLYVGRIRFSGALIVQSVF